MSNVAVIGLGIMGLPMAINLVKAGHSVTGFNRSQDKIDALVAEGGQGADQHRGRREGRRRHHHDGAGLPGRRRRRPRRRGRLRQRQAGRAVDRRLQHPPRRRQAARRRSRGRRHPRPRRPGLRWRAGRHRRRAVDHGRREAADFEAAQDVLDAVGKTIVHVGPAGAGQTVKAANQLIVAVNIQVLGEAVVFLEAYGVDTDAALKVLGGGLAGSKVLDQKGQKMLDRDFAPGFRLALHHKDMGIVTSAAREANGVTSRSAPSPPSLSPPPSTRATAASTTPDSSSRPSSSAAASNTAAPRRTSTPTDFQGEHHDEDAHCRRSRRHPGKGGRHRGVRPARRGDQPLLLRDAGPRRHPPHPRPARRRRLPHGRRVLPRQGRQHRHLHRHLRPRRHRHDHRTLRGLGRLHPHAVHHRAGTRRQAAQGRLPGRGHRVHRQAGHQDGHDVLEPGQIPGAFQKAFQLMRSGRPGPVLLDLPSTCRWPRSSSTSTPTSRCPVEKPTGQPQAAGKGAGHAHRSPAPADRRRRRHHQRLPPRRSSSNSPSCSTSRSSLP